jgi:hypothetical protein
MIIDSETLRASRDQSSTAKMAKDNNEKGLVHDATRNPKQEFRNVARESTKSHDAARNPKQEFRNVARESTKSHDAARNPKQEFRSVVRESRARRKPTKNKKEFRNVARESRARRKPTRNKKEFRNVAQARKPKQEFRKVAVIAPPIKHDGKYVEKDNEILRTKNDSKRMLLKIFHGIEVKSEAGDRKRLTSKNNKGKETLRTGNGDVSSLESVQSDDESSLGLHLF